MKKIQYILFLSISMLFVACQKEVIMPNNTSSTELNSQDFHSKSVTIQTDGSEVFGDEGSTIVDPTGRPKPSRPGSGGSK